MGRTAKNLTAQEAYPDSASQLESPPSSLYWYGMLPSTGTFKIKKHTRDRQQNGEYYTWQDATSEELWSRTSPSWIGRCPWRQSLSVNGFSFDAFTESLTRSIGASEGTLNRNPWPGKISELEDERFKFIVDQCYKNVMRVKDGLGSEINLGQLRSYMMLPTGEERGTKEVYNPRTDVYFAHYVYIIKLEEDPAKFSRESYEKLAMSWGEFFRDPPKSVFEMYPLEKAVKPEAPK